MPRCHGTGCKNISQGAPHAANTWKPTHCKAGRLTLPNGPLCIPERPVSQFKTAANPAAKRSRSVTVVAAAQEKAATAMAPKASGPRAHGSQQGTARKKGDPAVEPPFPVKVSVAQPRVIGQALSRHERLCLEHTPGGSLANSHVDARRKPGLHDRGAAAYNERIDRDAGHVHYAQLNAPGTVGTYIYAQPAPACRGGIAFLERASF